MKNISPNRLISLLLFLGLLPTLWIVTNYYSDRSNLNLMNKRLTLIQKRISRFEEKYSQNNTIRRQYQNADPLFIDKSLESMTFLEQEIEELEKIIKDPSFPDVSNLKQRLEYLSGKRNKLAFTEDTIQNYDQFKETLETTRHPVEINLYDLSRILSIVEKVTIKNFSPLPNSPQLIITDCKLRRKKHPNNNEVFSLDLQLLKREYF